MRWRGAVVRGNLIVTFVVAWERSRGGGAARKDCESVRGGG